MVARNIGRAQEVVVKKGRSFTSGVTCLCCLGGNCYMIGHVLSDCVCCCIENENRRNDSSGLMQARNFKQDYVLREQDFERKRVEATSEAKIRDGATEVQAETAAVQVDDIQDGATAVQVDNRLLVKLLSPNARKPTRGSSAAAGYDLYCSEENVLIPAGDRRPVDTGIAIAFTNPEIRVYARIAPRSGLSVRGLDIGAGVVDPDYRGSVKVLLINNSVDGVPFQINQGDRIAQLILERIETPECIIVDSLPETDRGTNGFGSTGLSEPLIGKFSPL